MTIRASSYQNFLTYLHSAPDGSILLSSNREPFIFAPRFGLPAEETTAGYEFVLAYHGITIHYRAEYPEDSLAEVDKILEIAQGKSILIPVEEGDSVEI